MVPCRGNPLDQNFYERVTTIHLDALNTENVKDMNDMFSERTVLTELKLGPNFVTKNVTKVNIAQTAGQVCGGLS